MRNLSDIADYVNQLSIDLRAETLIALIQNDLLEGKEILSAFEGQLKRKYSRDISKANVSEFESGEKALTFHLNRDGVYDALPEALFHSFSEEALLRGEEMARDSMKLKGEEKEARTFFQPFENQVFSQLVRLASKENSLFSDIYVNSLQGLIPDFWKIDRQIPKEYTERLVRLIPMAYKVVGNIDLTIQAFEFVLGEIVQIDFIKSRSNDVSGAESVSVGGGLGDCFLGVDTYSGAEAEIPLGKVRVSIGPLCNIEISHYRKGGWLMILLDSLYSHFLPMELVPETRILPSIEQLEFALGGDESKSKTYLGYNSVL